MRTYRLASALGAGVLVFCASQSAVAEQKTLQAMMPWTGEGTVFAVDTEKLLFMGSFEGVMYIEKAEGDLDAAFAECPGNMELMLESKKTSGWGYCMITGSGGDTVFAKWDCAGGGAGACTGNFVLTGGTGRFEGITGSSELQVRSVLAAIVAGLGSGSEVQSVTGLAILPKLSYELSAK